MRPVHRSHKTKPPPPRLLLLPVPVLLDLHTRSATSPYVLETCLVLLHSLPLPRWPSSSSASQRLLRRTATATRGSRRWPRACPSTSTSGPAPRRSPSCGASCRTPCAGTSASPPASCATGPVEQQAPPNLTLRPTAFKAINDIHDRLQKECGGAVVSCSDVLALAARDSVVVVSQLHTRACMHRIFFC